MTICDRPGCGGTVEDGYCDVAGHAYVAHQPNDAGAGEDEALRVQGAESLFDHLRPRLQYEDGRPPHRADVDRLVARVEDEDATGRSAMCARYRWVGVVGVPGGELRYAEGGHDSRSIGGAAGGPTASPRSEIASQRRRAPSSPTG